MANIRPRKDKDGNTVSYQIRVFKGRDELGKQLKPYVMTWKVPEGLTERQIKKQLNEITVNFEKECKLGFSTDNKQTFSNYAQYVLDLKEHNGLKHKTVVRYKELLERIDPHIGHLKLKEIRPQHLNDLYKKLGQEGERKNRGSAIAKNTFHEIIKNRGLSKAKLAELTKVAPMTITTIAQGKSVSLESAEKVSSVLETDIKKLFTITYNNKKLSNKTIVEHHRLISSIMAQAEKEMLIMFNPASKSTIPKIENKEANYFSDDDIFKIRACLENEPLKWKVAINLLLITGCRRGEILGIKWDKIDWKNHQIHICNNLLYTKDRGVYEDTTKTSQSNRYIKVPSEIIELLKIYKCERSHELELIGQALKETDFLFVQESGKPINPDSLTDYCSKFSRKYDLPHINPHAFRHTHISLLILNGIDIITASRRAGHSKTTTTVNTYGHVIKKADEIASDCIADVILRSNS